MSNNVEVAFITRSILHTHQFSWVFLVDWIMIITLAIFVLFYFNNLLGFVVTQTFCRYLWYRKGIYVKIQSIEISLLGGRILFRNVVYIGTSQAFRIVWGTLNWRYWVANRRKSLFIEPKEEERNRSTSLQLNISGVEWFIYNREVAYDTLGKKEPVSAQLVQNYLEWERGLNFLERKIAELFPLEIKARNMGIIIGNDDIESLLVIASPRINAIFDMAQPSNKHDRYKHWAKATFACPEAVLQDNPDYKVSSLTPEQLSKKKAFSKTRRGLWMNKLIKKTEENPDQPWLGLKRYMDTSETAEPNNPDRSNATRNDDLNSDDERSQSNNSDDYDNTESSTQKPDSEPNVSSSNAEFSEKVPLGDEKTTDSAYMKTNMSKHDPKFISRLAALPLEYAKISQIFTCDSLELTYQADAVGRVEDSEEITSKGSGENSEESSAEQDPMFDVHLEVQNGKVNYGPYAERQRQAFYSVFFPRNCEEAEAMPVTSTGTPCQNGSRIHPLLTTSIKFVDEATMVIPIREFSKDDEFANAFLRSLQNFEGDIQRTYGWLEIKACKDSTLNISVPLLPTSSGFKTEINLDLMKPDVRSSINHDTMFCAQHHSVKIILHQPLLWNAMQHYDIQQKSNELEFYALREHATLIADMINDFAAGPAVPYALFTPAIYKASWDVTKFSLYLNVNKGNIINQPTNLSENTFLIFCAPELHIQWNIPRTQITSPFTSVDTILEAPVVDLELSAPNWHTLHGFLDWQRMARVDKFKIHFQHHMTTLAIPRYDNEIHVEPSPSRFVDTQILDISGDQFAMTAHGFFVDYVLRIQENYFGHAYHFQTTVEFLQKRTEDISRVQHEFTRNDADSDIQMRVRVNKGCFLIPTRLYTCKDCISLHFMQLNVDCRFTNYYMDLQIEIAPLTGRLLHGLNPGTVHEEALQASSSTADLSISQIEGHAHRMFGLPPSEPTYVVKWDFDIGDITADFPLDFALALHDAMSVFGHAFRDVENKPVLPSPEVNDVVFVSFNVASIDATIRPPSTWHSHMLDNKNGPRFQLLTSSIKSRQNDLANNRYSAHRSIDVAFIGVKGYVRDDVLALDAQTAIHTTTFINKQHSKNFYEKQQSHIALQDIPFNRARFLLDNRHREISAVNVDDPNQILHPYIPITPFDPPLTRDNLKFLDPQFAVVGEQRESSDSDSAHTSLESLVNFSKLDDSSTESDSSYDEATSMLRKAKRAKADKARRDQDVFPYSSSTTTAERERLRCERSNFELNPSQWHPRSPKLPVDDEVANDSIVIQILPVKASFTPELVGLVEAFENDASVDFEQQLDSLQINIVRSLMKGEEVEEVVRVHLITQLITIDFSESIKSHDGVRLIVREVDSMLKLAGRQRGANVKFQSLSVALRHGSQDTVDVTTINAGALELSKFSFLWQVTSQEDGTGSVSLDSIDASFAANNIEWAVQYIGRLVQALPQTRRNSEAPNAPIISHNLYAPKAESHSSLTKQDKLKATFFALTMAGERMGVEQDSYVLSRPSGAIQSRAHVRSRTSWRLVVRLRYLLQRLPPSERLQMQKEIQSGLFKLPLDAKERSVAIYRRWRSWEQSDNIAESEIFRLVFDDKTFQEYVLSLSTTILVNIESMVARIVYPDMHDHFAGLDSLQMQLVSTRKNDIQNLNLTFRCGKARARASLDLLNVVATIIATLASLGIERPATEQKQSKPKTARKESLVNSTASVIDLELNEGMSLPKALQASVSVFILDLILEFDFATLRIETQNHQIQFTTAVEFMESSQLDSLFHTGTLVTSDGAFRIHERKQAVPKISRESDDTVVLDSLIQGVSLGYVSRGMGGERSNSWATLNVENISLITHPTAVELTEILVDFLETDLKAIQAAAKDLQKALDMQKAEVDLKDPYSSNLTESRSGASIPLKSDADNTLFAKDSEIPDAFRSPKNDSTVSTILPGGKYMNFNIESLKCRIRLVEELRFVLQGKEASSRIRKTDALVTSIDFGRCAVGIHFKDGSAAVASTQLENIRTVLRFDPELMALAVFNNFASIRLETMSIAWILEYFTNRHIDKQIGKILKNVERAFEILNEQDSSNRSSPAPSLSSEENRSPERRTKMKLRWVNRANEISIRLPLDTSSFKLTITGVRLHYENFETFQELETQNSNSPETMGAGVEDLRLDLLIARTPVREMIRLNFNGSVHRERGESLVNAESDYIRFALDPEAVGAIFVAVQKIKDKSMSMFPTRGAKVSDVSTQQPGASSGIRGESNEKSFEKILGLDKVRAKLLMQYLTITWYTGPESNEGVILGLDKLQVIVAKLISHTELAGAYVTPVSSSTAPVKDRLNTAYLPLVNINAFVARLPDLEKPSVKADINGKSIVVSLTPRVAFWVMALADSFVKANDTVERLIRTRTKSEGSSDSSTASKSTTVGSSSTDPVKSLELLFNLSINMHFDRGILRLLEDSALTKEPALELFSPTLDMIIELRKRKLMLRIDASRTKNQIFPKAISEIKAMLTMIALSMKQRAAKNLDQEIESERHYANLNLAKDRVPDSASLKLQGQDSQNSMFDKMELDVHVHFDPQELYLSCLPFGKVGAMLSTDGMDLLVVAPLSDPQHPSHTSIYGLIEKSKLSLQHMYSHEVSAMAEFQNLAFLGMQKHNRPYKMAINLNDPQVNINLSKLYDMRTFIDVWALFGNSATTSSEPAAEVESEALKLRRKYSTASSGSRPMISDIAPPMLGESAIEADGVSEPGEEPKHTEGKSKAQPPLIDKYKKAMTSVPFAFLANLNISNMVVVIGLGPAIGEMRMTLDRCWLAALQTVSNCQLLNAGVDTAMAQFEGRLGGAVKFENVMAKLALQWSEAQSYPLVHVKFRLKKFGFYFSLDFHPFIAGDMKDLVIMLMTQGRANANEDRLHVAMKCSSVSIVLTALVAAHTLDVISLFQRLQSQISNVPLPITEVGQGKAIRDSNKKEKREQRIAEHQTSGSGQAGIRVLIDIQFGEFLIHIFPTEFVDNTALKVYAQRFEIHFDRKHLANKSETGLDLAVDEGVVGLVTVKGGGYNRTLTDLDYEYFLEFVSKSSMGSTIVHTPEVTVLMDTWNDALEPHVVYFTFSNEIHGSVEVGWNLGSVNFIKEMINTHKNAWLSRQTEVSISESADGSIQNTAQAYRQATAKLQRGGSLPTRHRRSSTTSSIVSNSSIGKEPSNDGEPSKEENSLNATVFMDIKYIAKRKPIILIPQLRDLGDATPPIEWLGVNRARIPMLLHYFLTREIEQGANEIEKVYLGIIGRLE